MTKPRKFSDSIIQGHDDSPVFHSRQQATVKPDKRLAIELKEQNPSVRDPGVASGSSTSPKQPQVAEKKIYNSRKQRKDEQNGKTAFVVLDSKLHKRIRIHMMQLDETWDHLITRLCEKELAENAIYKD